MDDVSSSSDEEEQTTERPYNELLQLLHTNTDSKGPARKKRKLGSNLNTEEAPSVEEATSDGEQEDNALEVQAPSDDEDGGQEVDDDDDDVVGPFEKHFNLIEEADLTKKVQQIRCNKWKSAKKEVNELRLVHTIPDIEEEHASLLPAVKTTSTLKVRRCYFTY